MAELPRVLAGDDGLLYLGGGANAVLNLYRPGYFDAACPWPDWRARIAARTAFFAEAGMEWRMLLAPEKLSVLGTAQLAQWLGEYVIPGDRFLERIGAPQILSPRRYLVDQSRTYCCYSRTDSHWTGLGALSAFQIFAASLGLDPDYEVFARLQPLEQCFHGDLWSPDREAVPPDVFRRYRVPDSIEIVYANPLVGYKNAYGLQNEPGLHAGSHIVVRNERAEFPKTLALFGSSFSEYRLECSLLTFVCALFFRTVHFIWSVDLDLDYIASHRPDYVLIEMPERFLLSCPADDLCVEEHAVRRLAEYGTTARRNWRRRAGEPGASRA